MDSNPHNLKIVDEKPSGYLDADEFIAFCNRKKIIIKRKDNLPRFCKNNDIKMIKIKRIGSSGSTPTCYKIPSESKINEIIDNLKINNNSLLGREIADLLAYHDKDLTRILLRSCPLIRMACEVHLGTAPNKDAVEVFRGKCPCLFVWIDASSGIAMVGDSLPEKHHHKHMLE